MANKDKTLKSLNTSFIQFKHKNKLMRENYFLEFRRLQNNATCFIYKWDFYKQDMVEI